MTNVHKVAKYMDEFIFAFLNIFMFRFIFVAVMIIDWWTLTLTLITIIYFKIQSMLLNPNRSSTQ